MPDTRFRQLELARRALEQGAHISTVSDLTGLPTKELRRAFPVRAGGRQAGRRATPETIVKSSACHAAHLYGFYVRLRGLLFTPPEAILASYDLYWQRYGPHPDITFDSAVVVLRAVENAPSCSAAMLSARRCAVCNSQYLDCTLSSQSASAACPFCNPPAGPRGRGRPRTRLDQRPPVDPRAPLPSSSLRH